LLLARPGPAASAVRARWPENAHYRTTGRRSGKRAKVRRATSCSRTWQTPRRDHTLKTGSEYNNIRRTYLIPSYILIIVLLTNGIRSRYIPREYRGVSLPVTMTSSDGGLQSCRRKDNHGGGGGGVGQNLPIIMATGCRMPRSPSRDKDFGSCTASRTSAGAHQQQQQPFATTAVVLNRVTSSYPEAFFKRYIIYTVITWIGMMILWYIYRDGRTCYD